MWNFPNKFYKKTKRKINCIDENKKIFQFSKLKTMQKTIISRIVQKEVCKLQQQKNCYEELGD